MTLFLQYNINSHIWDGALHLWWPSVLSVNLSVLSKNLLNSEPPLCNPGYAPVVSFPTYCIYFLLLYCTELFKTKILNLKKSREWSLQQKVRKQGAVF